MLENFTDGSLTTSLELLMTASRTVPFFNYPRAYLDDREDIIKILEDVGSRGAFIMQKDLHDFE